MTVLIDYLSCAALWLGLAVKTPDLVHRRHDPQLRAICAVLGLAGMCFFLGAAPTVGAVNRLSGVPNLAAPLTYAAITAYSAASQVLIVRWRGGERVRQVVRCWVVAYAVVLVAVAVLFALGRAPVERRTDLDTYYATTPYIAEMIVLYLLGHLVAVSVTTVSALRWARRVRGWLRAGLVLLGLGSLCSVGFSVAKSVAVAARWCGRDWPVLGTRVSPAAAGLGALVTSVGVLVPLAGPRLARWHRSWRTYTRLAPLERELDTVLTHHALRLPRPRWASPTTRLIWRQTSIHNALGYLDASLDGTLYDRVHAGALAAGDDESAAEAVAWAVVIRGAVRGPAGFVGAVGPAGPAGLAGLAGLAGAAELVAVPPSGRWALTARGPGRRVLAARASGRRALAGPRPLADPRPFAGPAGGGPLGAPGGGGGSLGAPVNPVDGGWSFATPVDGGGSLGAPRGGGPPLAAPTAGGWPVLLPGIGRPQAPGDDRGGGPVGGLDGRPVPGVGASALVDAVEAAGPAARDSGSAPARPAPRGARPVAARAAAQGAGATPAVAAPQANGPASTESAPQGVGPAPTHAAAQATGPAPTHAAAQATGPAPTHAAAQATGPAPTHAAAQATGPAPTHAAAQA
ncbi:MAB_1171c family putative transporter, partial [Streptomyces sp. NPDC047017]|uniref:MAB_1171c family putative transporter n=1 Tax=Streptomyces sp. NPDC047017 TaxID=3155024 RepID=UPI0033CF5B3B